eukprot:171621_1
MVLPVSKYHNRSGGIFSGVYYLTGLVEWLILTVILVAYVVWLVPIGCVLLDDCRIHVRTYTYSLHKILHQEIQKVSETFLSDELKWTSNARSKALVIIGDALPHE